MLLPEEGIEFDALAAFHLTVTAAEREATRVAANLVNASASQASRSARRPSAALPTAPERFSPDPSAEGPSLEALGGASQRGVTPRVD